MIPGLRAALREIDAKHREEPDYKARCSGPESEDEIELSGDDLARLEQLEDL